MGKIALQYDKNHKNLTYGYWRCPECDYGFFGGGKALHKEDCSLNSYMGCIYVVGPDVISRAKQWAEEHGDDCIVPLNPVTLAELREQLPEAC